MGGRRSARLPTMPALDGIRALAIAGVLLYHGDILWVPGGLLGVEVFFVLSGYLITSLLLADLRVTGRIALGDFWRRRARRLLPALAVMVALVSVAFLVGWPEEVARIRGDVGAAATYTSNWYLIHAHRSYFESFARPSPFGHLWSLAIEEQFYLLWPLAIWLLWARLRRPGRMAAVLGLGALGSAVALWVLLNPDDPSRVYYGTDTRASALLIGSALALVWHPFTRPRRRWRTPAWLLDLLALAAGGTVVWAFLRFEDLAPSTYRPGLLGVALATAALIGTAVHPNARLARVLGAGPLRALGRRSYSIYLWYWPVFVVTRPGVDLELSTGAAFAWRLALTLVLAELSFRCVEEPIRQGALGRLARRLAAVARTPGGRRRAGAAVLASAAASLLFVSSVAVAMVKAPEAGSRPSAATAVPVPLGRLDEFGEFDASFAAAAAAARRFRHEVVAVGDSVMAGAATALRARLRSVPIHARVGMQVDEGIALLERLRAAGEVGRVVVIHLGDNGRFTDAQFERIMSLLADVERVIFVTVKVPRRWEPWVNRTLAAGVARHPDRARLLPWRDSWRSCGVRVFVADGTHLTAAGARCYAEQVAAAVAAA
jgi:peptidoglycan/LPS O-acetylase OafA/YrhL